jgi:hypothetical protein
MVRLQISMRFVPANRIHIRDHAIQIAHAYKRTMSEKVAHIRSMYLFGQHPSFLGLLSTKSLSNLLERIANGIFGNFGKPVIGSAKVTHQRNQTYCFFKDSISAILVRSLPCTAALKAGRCSDGIIRFCGFAGVETVPTAADEFSVFNMPLAGRCVSGTRGGCMSPRMLLSLLEAAATGAGSGAQ